MPLSPMLKKLLFVRQFDIDKGKINLLGSAEVMLNASAILGLQEIDETKVYKAAKESSLKDISGAVEHAKVYGKMREVLIEEIAELGKKIGQTDAGTIKTLQDIFNVYGLGEMAITNIDNAKKQAIISLRSSTIAESWQESNRTRAKKPVCSLTAGVLAGMFSFIFGKEVECVEDKCKSQGNGYCLFKIG